MLGEHARGSWAPRPGRRTRPGRACPAASRRPAAGWSRGRGRTRAPPPPAPRPASAPAPDGHRPGRGSTCPRQVASSHCHGSIVGHRDRSLLSAVGADGYPGALERARLQRHVRGVDAGQRADHGRHVVVEIAVAGQHAVQAEVEAAGGGADVAGGTLLRQLRTDVLQLARLDREPLEELHVQADQRRVEDGAEAQAPAPDQRLHPACRRRVADADGRGDLRVGRPAVGGEHLRDRELLRGEPLGLVPLAVARPGAVGAQQRDRVRPEQPGVPLLHRRELADDDHGFGLDDVVRPRQPVDEHRRDVAVVRHDELRCHVGAAGDDGDEAGDVQRGERLGDDVGGARAAPQPHLQGDAEPAPQVVEHTGHHDDAGVEQLLPTARHRGLRGPDRGRHLLPRGPPVQLERSDDALVQLPDRPDTRHPGSVRCGYSSCQAVRLQLFVTHRARPRRCRDCGALTVR